MDRDAANNIAAGIIAKINSNEGDAGDIVAKALQTIWEDGWDEAVKHVMKENKKYLKGGAG